MGLGGSVWVDIEGIRSHMGYKGSGMADTDLGCHIISKYFWMLVFETLAKQLLEKYEVTGARTRGPKILVRPAPTFLTYSWALEGLILQFLLGPNF